MTPRGSALLLVAANLVPVVGVLLFDWRVFDLLVLYWVESVVIGVINVLRMAVCTQSLNSPRFRIAFDTLTPEQQRALGNVGSIAKLIMIPFFALHYGLFCWGHLSFITLLFGPDGGPRTASELFFGSDGSGALLIAVAAIFGSHLYSFFANFIGKREYERTNLVQLMQRPYGRIIVMQVTVIAGGALVEFLDAPELALLVLVAMKTAMDLKLHSSERTRFAEPA